ncbi:hypothetical protein FRC09_002398 [Ceratobasidium sp. 395]|nr:hypothetical protein FRC09_002398 [Ceratobasidium sp. 395]
MQVGGDVCAIGSERDNALEVDGLSGYDTAFTTRLRRDGRLELDVDLPDEAFPPEEGDMATTNNEPGTRKLDSSTSTTIPSTVSGKSKLIA